LFIDADGDGLPSPGDTLVHNVTIDNVGNQVASGVTFNDIPDANTSLVVASFRTNLGAITRGNAVGDTQVAITIGDLPAGSSVAISFQVRINNPVPVGVTQVRNQGTVSSTDPRIQDVFTDDPDTPVLDDPTITLLDLTPTAIDEEPEPPLFDSRVWLPAVSHQ